MDVNDNLHMWALELAEDPDVDTALAFKGPRGLFKLCPNDRDLVGRSTGNAKEYVSIASFFFRFFGQHEMPCSE